MLHSIELSPDAPTGVDMRPADFEQAANVSVVYVSALEARLSANGASDAVLQILCETDELLTSVNLNHVRCGLVSYRQEQLETGVRVAPHRRFQALREPRKDGRFTMDASTLLSIVAAAHRLGLDALWLDAWCYRVDESGYVHDDFCRKLHQVVSGVTAVVWLPRSRTISTGQYGYRLWCTFEAAIVQQRELPVAVAGCGESAFQRHVRRFGSFAPALWGDDDTIQRLCRLNLCAYLAVLSSLTQTVVWISTSSMYIDWNQTKALNNLLAMAVVMLLWRTARTALGQQVRLAKNACTVLRIMRKGQEPSASELGDRQQGDQALTCRLLHELPWLGAYDRRDALVVQDLLGRSHPDVKLRAQGVHTLALAAWIAARLRPSPGDATAGALCLREWLHQRDIDLCACGGCISKGEHVRSRATDAATSAEDGKAVSDGGALDGLSWLDGGEAAASKTALAEDCLPLTELGGFELILVPGWSCALLTPLGILKVAPPDRGRWRIQAWSQVATVGIGSHVIHLLIALIISYLGGAAVDLVYFACGRGTPSCLAATTTDSLFAFFNILLAVVTLVILCLRFRMDVTNGCGARRFAPLPFSMGKMCCFRGAAAYCVILICIAGASSLFGKYVYFEWEDFLGTPVEQHGARLVNFAITVVGRTLIATFFAYELILVCVLLVFGSCVRGGFGAHGDSLS
jgi:hypothetical protein